MHGWQDRIGIDKYSGLHTYFIVGTISYDKHCNAKVSVADVQIVHIYLIN